VEVNMPNGLVPIPKPVNEPIRAYAPGSPEKVSLKAAMRQMLSEEIEIPLIIGGKEVRTGNTAKAVCPHDHQHVLNAVGGPGRDLPEGRRAAGRPVARHAQRCATMLGQSKTSSRPRSTRPAS
jgi:hypothetical protein